jgi:nucleoside-diphosphate-sugar epimerase
LIAASRPESTLGNNVTVLAGATGHLGGLIARGLRDRGTRVRAVVRVGTSPGKITDLARIGVATVEVDFDDGDQLTRACDGGACVVSALAGMRETIVDAQMRLLEAAVRAGVPRFIPSDFAIDFYKMPEGSNRNLDWRREFAQRLDAAPISATSILNGMFAALLRGQAPFIVFPLHRVVYWENADQPMDFTTIEDTAAFTAAAALDPLTPRFLRIAGDVVTARELEAIVENVTGDGFKLVRAGPLSRLEKLIAVAKTVAPGTDDLYPAWQGMQYMHNMFDGRAKLEPLDNARYPDLRWTLVRDVLAQRTE